MRPYSRPEMRKAAGWSWSFAARAFTTTTTSRSGSVDEDTEGESEPVSRRAASPAALREGGAHPHLRLVRSPPSRRA
jgi:hypothetical protein